MCLFSSHRFGFHGHLPHRSPAMEHSWTFGIFGAVLACDAGLQMPLRQCRTPSVDTKGIHKLLQEYPLGYKNVDQSHAMGFGCDLQTNDSLRLALFGSKGSDRMSGKDQACCDKHSLAQTMCPLQSHAGFVVAISQSTVYYVYIV